MKVLVVTNWYPTETKPIYGIFVQDQVRALAAEHDIRVIAPELVSPAAVIRGTIPPPFRAGVDATGTLVVRPRVLSPIPGYPAVVAAPFSTAVRKAYESSCASWGPPDVIHAHVVLNAGYAAVELGQRLGVPVVITEHATSGSTWLRTPFRRGLAADVYMRADTVIAVSPALAARVHEVAVRKVEVIGNVVDTDFFVPANQESSASSVRFTFVGALIERKGADHLIRAAGRLAQTSDLTFDVQIGGAGPERPAIERLVSELDLDARVTFLGALDRAGVKRALGTGDVAVMPSHEETFGVAAAEAMAMGLPLVGFQNGGFDYVVSEGPSKLVPDNDESALTEAMKSVAGSLTAEGRSVTRASIVDRFSPHAFRAAIDEVYAAVSR